VAYLENFSRVKVFLFDDLKKDTLGLMKDVYNFLDVDDTFVPNVSFKYNISGVPQNRLLHNFLTKSSRLKTGVKDVYKLFFPEQSLYKFVERLRTRNLEKIQMNDETQAQLKVLFREDILKLQDLTGKDLSVWLS